MPYNKHKKKCRQLGPNGEVCGKCYLCPRSEFGCNSQHGFHSTAFDSNVDKVRGCKKHKVTCYIDECRKCYWCDITDNGYKHDNSIKNKRKVNQLLEAEKVTIFLKSKFPKHITEDGSNKSGHKLEYGLCEKAYSETSPHTCADCQLPFKIFSDLKGHVNQCHHSLLKDCEQSTLYMGHIVCVTNQRIAIKKEIQKLSNEPSG
jgi:hypothetical protein